MSYGGMLVAISACSVALVVVWRRGGGRNADIAELRERVRTLENIWKAEKEEQTDRRGNTLERLTTLDGRMTAHEKTCMSALSDLESALGTR